MMKKRILIPPCARSSASLYMQFYLPELERVNTALAICDGGFIELCFCIKIAGVWFSKFELLYSFSLSRAHLPICTPHQKFLAGVREGRF